MRRVLLSSGADGGRGWEREGGRREEKERYDSYRVNRLKKLVLLKVLCLFLTVNNQPRTFGARRYFSFA